ncbi:MAG: glycoside hydrolase family 1 protein, partial [Bacteroidota bacterium]
MNRRETLRIMGLSSASLLLQGRTILKATPGNEIKATDFGNDFTWGTATASYQIEGGWNLDGKGTSIWDTFTEKPGNIADGADGKTACDFYHRYQKDIQILKNLGFDSFRFSLSWPRIIPSGTGKINHKGLDFYKKVIDSCLENGIEPWITLYHWDLPQALEDKGGWTNRDIIHWFNEFSHVASRELGDRVKKWIILNEPLSFTAFGYMTGYHAPGRKGFRNFLPAVHHAAMCQAGSARVIRENVQNAYIGTTFSCSPVQAVSEAGHHQKAARRIDALLNRLFIEPALGMGYPADDLPVLAKLEKYMLPGDEDMLKFDFD